MDITFFMIMFIVFFVAMTPVWIEEINKKGKDKTAISGYDWDDNDDWDDPINDPAYSDCICNNYYTGD